MKAVLLCVLVLSVQASAWSQERESPRHHQLERIVSRGAEDTLATLFALGQASRPALCGLLESEELFRGSLGNIGSLSTYQIDISEEELSQIDDPQLRSAIEPMRTVDENLVLRRSLTVGEAAAYLLSAILKEDYFHALTAELVDLQGRQLEESDIAMRLGKVSRELCEMESLSAEGFSQALEAQGLQHDPR